MAADSYRKAVAWLLGYVSPGLEMTPARVAVVRAVLDGATQGLDPDEALERLDAALAERGPGVEHGPLRDQLPGRT